MRTFTPIYRSPFEFIKGFDQDLAQVFNGFQNGFQNDFQESQAARRKDFETSENANAWLLNIDLPGVKTKDLDIEVEGATLKISGTRKTAFGEGRQEQRFFRSFSLPEGVDNEKIQAHMEDGVLSLALPKNKKESAKKIEISTGEKSKTWKNFLSFGQKPGEKTLDQTREQAESCLDVH